MTRSPYASVASPATGSPSTDSLPLPAKVDLLAAEVADQERLIEHLQLALHNSRRIGIALGVLMTRRGIDRTQALELLSAASRRMQRKVVEIADEVAERGDLPD